MTGTPLEMPRLLLAVIGDEISPSLDDMIDFCVEEGVSRLEMRTVGGRNLLGMELDEIAEIASRIHQARLSVPTFVSPVLKWPAPGQTSRGGKVDFALDPDTCPTGDPFQHAFDICIMLGATRLRIFSWLRYDDYQPGDLTGPLGQLCDLADEYGVDLQVENENVCNVGSLDELDALMRTFSHRRIRPLVDISNAYGLGTPPSMETFKALAPRTDHLSLKDRKLAERKTVPIGQGDVPFDKVLPVLLAGTKSREVLASIETHVPSDPRNATRQNVHALRHLAEHLGVDID